MYLGRIFPFTQVSYLIRIFNLLMLTFVLISDDNLTSQFIETICNHIWQPLPLSTKLIYLVVCVSIYPTFSSGYSGKGVPTFISVLNSMSSHLLSVFTLGDILFPPAPYLPFILWFITMSTQICLSIDHLKASFSDLFSSSYSWFLYKANFSKEQFLIFSLLYHYFL